MTLLSRQNAPLLLLALIVAVGWAYVPPIGPEIKLPDIAPFLEPDVPHAEPVFIHAGSNVYYRVRLKQLVPLSYARQHYEKMRREGVQWRPYGDSPFRPFARLKGWDVAFVREKSLKPYTIEYWKVSDNRNPSFPVKLRWPWLEVRLGADVLNPPKAVVVVPERGVAWVDPRVPLPEGAIVTAVHSHGAGIRVDFLHALPRLAIARFYETELHASFRAEDGREPYRLFAREGAAIVGIRSATPGLRWLSLELPWTVFDDEWVSVYAARDVAKLSPEGDQFQPARLTGLPSLTPVVLRLNYGTPEEAAAGLAVLARRPNASRPNS